ncbi:MAG: hypothetical protein C5B48_11235 [Candidatus Rokuibacteriota bacterium]|nr:MAG: hypothetical protein C5B48_11235 [Candidatus Rokubacteria bacterium]
MSLFKREPLHVRLAREGGLSEEPLPHDTTPRWGVAGIHGVPRPREWDASALVEAPDLPGGEADFVALPDGTLVVEGDGDVEALAEALEAQIDPPYRAHAVRRDERFWGVGAHRTEVVQLQGVLGDEIELSLNEGVRSLVIDGLPAFQALPDLERLAEQRGYASYALRAERLDADLFEVQAAPL